MHVTKEEVKRLLKYNPITGDFTWKPAKGEKWAGKLAGNINTGGYRRIFILGKYIAAHRLAFMYMSGNIPPAVDHIDGNKLNNSWNNLRSCTTGENNCNVGPRANSKSGIKGVSWHKASNKWIVQVGAGGKKKYIGVFKNLELAELIAHEARLKFHKEFARSK